MENENDNTDPDNTAGSPVLGSSTFKRKFLKNQCSRKKAKLRLSDRFGDQLLVSDGPSESTNNSKKSDVIKVVDEHERLKENELPSGRYPSSPNALSKIEQHKTVTFQTASGKPLFSKKESSEFASKLMDEFFNPLAVPVKEKKHSFLSKESIKGNSKSESTKCQNISGFSGFNNQEYNYSLERSKSFHKIIHKINMQHSQDKFKNDVLYQHINDNQCSENNNQFNTEIEILDDLKDDIHAKIEKDLVKERKSICKDNSFLDFTENTTSIKENFDKTKDFTKEKTNDINKDSLSLSINKNLKTGESKKENNIFSGVKNEYAITEEIKKRENVPQFITGSGKKVNINSSSVKRLKVIFQDIPDIKVFENVITLSNNPETNLGYMEEEITNNENRQIVSNAEDVPQFATASGKKITISSDKLSKINSIFKDIADLPNDFALNPKITSNKKPSVGHIGNLEPRNYGNKSIKNTISNLPHKQVKINTASKTDNKCKDYENSSFMSPNQRIASERLMETPLSKPSRLGKILNNIEDSKYSTLNSVEEYTEERVPVFSTASGSIDMKANVYEESTQEITSLFSTASGKTIKLPSSSLTGIDNIFKDIPNISDVKTNIGGFSPLRMNKTSNTTPGIPDSRLNDITEIKFTPLKKTIIEGNSNKRSALFEQETDEKFEDKDNMNYITPQRSLPKKKRLGSSLSRNGKMSEVAMNKARSLFGDMNFDDLKLPSHLKFGSPSLTEFAITPKKSNQISTPQYSSTPIRRVSKNDSFLNDVHDVVDQGFAIQRPNSTSLKDLEEELERQRRTLEKEIEFVTRKRDAIRMQIEADGSNIRYKLEPQSKKNKFNLKDVKNMEIQSNCIRSINSSILQVNPQNAVLLHFSNNWQNVPTVTTEDGCTMVPNKHGLIGISEIEPAFSSMVGVEKNLIPKGWIKNHYRWIVWKLASYKRFFPATLGDCLTVDNVIKQLKYRYIRELYNAERPALRKIYEKDDIPQKKMVLCISNIIKNEDNTELELTDGWYSIRTKIDEPLCHQINNKKVKIGSKLIISGAELLNCDGCHPLEIEEARTVRLKINFNSTRRAAWFSKLGYQKDPSPLLIKLSSAVWNGGNIGRITVYIMRIYPVIYREKTEATIFWRNKNAEYKKIEEYENECLKKYEEDNNVNIVRRNVCSLLQMTVIDVFDDIPKPFKCIIWDSTDSHQEQLKENQAITCFNLTLRCNSELSCTKKSYFQPSKHNIVKYEKYRRKYVELASYQDMLENVVFGEFDTTGFIVKMHIEHNSQYFWLTDLKNNFLLVKIDEGPNHCLLLSKVEEECLVAVCNLTLNSSKNGYLIATAGFQTILTQYPQYDFLRKKMEEQGNKMADDLESIFRENRRIIANFENGNKAEHSSESEGNTLNFSKVTSTDAVMSMINIDEIVNKHTM